MSSLRDAFSLEEAAVLYVESLRCASALEVAGVDQLPDASSVPRWSVRCGEAYMLIPAVARLVLILYPQLADADHLEQAMYRARMVAAAGVAN